MKSSILIFVLATIIYGCQCAPTLELVEDIDNIDWVKQDMQNFRNELNEFKDQRNQKSKEENPQTETTPNCDQEDNDGKRFNSGNLSSITSWKTVDGNRVEETVEERKYDNSKLKIIIKHTPALKKIKIQIFQCGVDANSQCTSVTRNVLEDNEYL